MKSKKFAKHKFLDGDIENIYVPYRMVVIVCELGVGLHHVDFSTRACGISILYKSLGFHAYPANSIW